MLCAFCAQITFAQEVRVIDNKGTLKDINNNIVTSSGTTPSSPFKGDVWIDTSTTPNTINIYDGANWINSAHTGTTGSVFFAGATGAPTEDNDQLFWDNTNNRLGVGTDNPSNKLHVTGAIRSEGILNSSGNAGGPSYRFNGDIDTGVYNPAADELGFSVGGIEAMLIDEPTIGNTKVIIKQTLELDGKVLDESNSTGTAGQVLSATTTGTAWVDVFTPTVSERYPNATQTVAESATFTTINFQSQDFAPTATDYTNASDGITVLKAGRYKITYRVTSEVRNNTRVGGEFHLTENSTVVNNTKTYTYQRNDLVDKNTATMVKILDLVANDKIGVQGRVYDSSRGSADSLTILPEGTMLTIEKIN